MPILKTTSNTKLKFPNGAASRSVLCFKILDVLLLISLRLGREITHVKMDSILRVFFNGFSVLMLFPNLMQLRKQLMERTPSMTKSLKPTHERKVSHTNDSWIFKKDVATGASGKYQTQSFGLLSLTNDSSEQNNEEPASGRDDDALKDELFDTFSPELAHKAYFAISRYISR